MGFTPRSACRVARCPIGVGIAGPESGAVPRSWRVDAWKGCGYDPKEAKMVFCIWSGTKSHQFCTKNGKISQVFTSIHFEVFGVKRVREIPWWWPGLALRPCLEKMGKVEEVKVCNGSEPVIWQSCLWSSVEEFQPLLDEYSKVGKQCQAQIRHPSPCGVVPSILLEKHHSWVGSLIFINQGESKIWGWHCSMNLRKHSWQAPQTRSSSLVACNLN